VNGFLAAGITFAILANAARSDTTLLIYVFTATLFTVVGVIFWFADRHRKR
jgi:hypothetical protein